MPDTEPTFPLEVIEEADMPPATDHAIRELLCECFPADAEAYARRRAWHDSVPAFTVISRQANRMLGHLAVVIRTVACGHQPVTVAGIQSFCVVPPHRGTGLSVSLMARALDEALRRKVRFGLLFCVPELEHVYRPLGWSKTIRPVVMLDEGGQSVPLPAKNICMLTELGDEGFPPGPLDLQGRDW